MRGKILLMMLIASLILVVGCTAKDEVVEVNKPIEVENFTQIGKGNLFTDNVVGNVYPCMKQVEDKSYIEIRTVDGTVIEEGMQFLLLYGETERVDAEEQLKMTDNIPCVIKLAATDTEITEELYNSLLILNTYYIYEKN